MPRITDFAELSIVGVELSTSTSGLGRTLRSARMRRRNAPSNRLAASWCDPKSAVCTTATNGKPPDRAWLHRPCDRRSDVEVCLRARSTASPERHSTAYVADGLLGWSNGHLSRRTDCAGKSPARCYGDVQAVHETARVDTTSALDLASQRQFFEGPAEKRNRDQTRKSKPSAAGFCKEICQASSDR